MESKEMTEGLRRLAIPTGEAVEHLRVLAILCDKATRLTCKQNFILKRCLKGKPKWLPRFLWRIQFYDVDSIRNIKENLWKQ